MGSLAGTRTVRLLMAISPMACAPRLLTVTENQVGATTSYAYDALDDLASVSQSGGGNPDFISNTETGIQMVVARKGC